MSEKIQNDIEKIEQALNIRLDDVEIEAAFSAAFPLPVSRRPEEQSGAAEYNLSMTNVPDRNSRCSLNDKLLLIQFNSSINLCYQRHLFQLSKYSQTIDLRRNSSSNRGNKFIQEIVPLDIFEIDKAILSSQLTTGDQSLQTIRREIQREEKSRMTSSENVDKLIEIVANSIRSNRQNQIRKKSIELLEKSHGNSNDLNEQICNLKTLLEELKSSSNKFLSQTECEDAPIDWKHSSQLLLNNQWRAESCEFVWKQICLPKIKFNEKWSQQEDQLLQRLVEIHGENASSWEQIASHFPRRSQYMCISHYMHLENTRLDRLKFSMEQQNEFKRLIENNRCGNYIPLNKVAYKLGSSLKSVRRQWRSIDSNVRRGTWTDQEDHVLLESVSKQKDRLKINWNLVSSDVFGRSQSKCYQRYIHLIRHNDAQDFQPDDDQLLIQQHILHHGRWFEIQRSFPGRSSYSLQNRYKKLLEHLRINSLFSSQQMNIQSFLLKEYPLKSSPSSLFSAGENLYEKPRISLTYKQLKSLVSNRLFEDFCNRVDLDQINNHITIRKFVKLLPTLNDEHDIRKLFIK